MNEKQAIEAISMIESQYNRQYIGAQRSKIIAEFRNYSLKAAGKAVDDLLMSFTSLPSPKHFIDKVKEHGAKEFEGQAHKEKREAIFGTEKAFNSQSGQGVKCFTLICSMMFDEGRRFPRSKILDGFRHASTQTGCEGWNVEGAKLQNWYNRNGLSMDDPPVGGMSI